MVNIRIGEIRLLNILNDGRVGEGGKDGGPAAAVAAAAMVIDGHYLRGSGSCRPQHQRYNSRQKLMHVIRLVESRWTDEWNTFL